MKKILSLSLALLSSSIFAMQLDIVREPVIMKAMQKHMCIDSQSVFVPSRLGQLELMHDKKGFSVYKDNQKHAIEKYNVDRLVRDMTKEELKSFVKVGYFHINQMDNGQYSLKADGRINGGGPILGAIVYWTVKVVCYAVPVAALGTVTVATAGAAAPAVAGTLAAAGTALTSAAATTTAAATIATTAGVVTGTAAVGASVGVAAGIAGAAASVGLASEAAIVTAAAVSTAGGVAGAAIAIEGIAAAAGTFFGMLPTP